MPEKLNALALREKVVASRAAAEDKRRKANEASADRFWEYVVNQIELAVQRNDLRVCVQYNCRSEDAPSSAALEIVYERLLDGGFSWEEPRVGKSSDYGIVDLWICWGPPYDGYVGIPPVGCLPPATIAPPPPGTRTAGTRAAAEVLPRPRVAVQWRGSASDFLTDTMDALGPKSMELFAFLHRILTFPLENVADRDISTNGTVVWDGSVDTYFSGTMRLGRGPVGAIQQHIVSGPFLKTIMDTLGALLANHPGRPGSTCCCGAPSCDECHS